MQAGGGTERSARKEGGPLSAGWWRAPLGPPPHGGDALAWAAVALLAGVFLWFWLPAPPPWTLAILPLPLLLVAWQRFRHPWLLYPALLLAGLALTDARIQSRATAILPANIGGVEMLGRVEEVRPHHPGQVRMILRVRAIAGIKRRYWPGRVRLTVFTGGKRRKGRRTTAARARPVLPLPGDEVRLRARLLRLPRPVEPGAYDPARDLYMAGIGAIGFASLKNVYVLASDCDGCGPVLWLGRLVERLRRAIAAEVRAHLSDRRAAALALALMTGERGALSRDTVERLRAAGLAHILAISGLHLGLVAGAVFWLLRAVLAAFPALALNWPIKKIAAAAALVVALAYLLLSGNSVATRRAFIMLAVALLALVLDRPAISMRNLAVAALAILFLAPHKAVSAGFQMSFMAVMGLVAFHEFLAWWRHQRTDDAPREGPRDGRHRLWRRPFMVLAGLLLTTLVASLFTALPAAWHFNRLPTWSLLGNLAALPLLTAIVMPAGLLALVLMPLGLAAPALAIMQWGLSGILRVANAIAGLPHPWWTLPAMSATAAFLLASGLIWLALRADRARLLGLVPILAALLSPFAPRADVLVEERARLLAIRAAPGGLRAAAPPGRAGDFSLRVWLRRDGDPATPQQARNRRGWSCDALACRATIAHGKRVLYFKDVFRKRRKGAGSVDEMMLEDMRKRCEGVDMVIAAFPLRGLCRHGMASVVVDRFDVWRDGAHAVFIGKDGRFHVRHVRGALPRRPWAAPPLPRAQVQAQVRAAARPH